MMNVECDESARSAMARGSRLAGPVLDGGEPASALLQGVSMNAPREFREGSALRRAAGEDAHRPPVAGGCVVLAVKVMHARAKRWLAGAARKVRAAVREGA